MAINLLPTDLSPKGPVVRAASILRSLATASFIVFFVAVLGMAAFFILNSVTLTSITNRSEELKASIASLEETEQRLILVRDRLSKVKQVLGAESGSEEVDGLEEITSGLGTGTVLSEAIVDKNSLEASFIVSSSEDLTQLMSRVITQETFNKVELVSFSFNPAAGYVPSFIFSNK